MRRNTLWICALAGVMALGGCDEQDGTPLQVIAEPDQDLVIEVSSATGTTTPTYGWTGEPARELTVTAVGSGRLQWRIESVDFNQGFDTPVQHGVVPAGARQTVQPLILEPDVRYAIRVVGVDGAEGRAEFVP